ncbi:phosphocholine cytidylyltransferase family protein [Pedobacter gandavensis]|uniref:phosphocholine cytidylyltransferase family protein n=1 Tax=Pedobacter gandavensis TaxID=2679963 RepID=UPI0024799C47|nr:phosphocholine cytidylyltransferase family protein [Pedobacter gandavensis]WGQ10946.1 phosphocholine cytidylyltransferase family protein [Pedobacter gandavensis]
MKVIIPAAGMGERLRPLTAKRPKCLVTINGKPIVYYLLLQLKELNISEVIIITGYKSQMIERYISDNAAIFPKITLIFNNKYNLENSTRSISLTRRFWKEEFMIIDSDLLLNKSIIIKAMTAKSSILLIDNSKTHDSIDMKASIEGNYIFQLDKNIEERDTFGEFFGVSKWLPKDAIKLSTIIDSIIKTDKNAWYEFAIRELAKSIKIPYETCSCRDWIEIDTLEDLAKAQKFEFIL